MMSHEPVDGIPPNLPENVIGASLTADYALVTLTSLSWSQEDLNDKFLYSRYLLNQWMDFLQTCIDTSLFQAKELIRFW